MIDRPPPITPKITQEMINLYDEYTHITLDRRAYLTKLAALAGSTAAAVAVTSLIENDKAAAQIVPADDPRVKAERVTYPGEGGEMAGYLVRPANATGRLPAVIVIHENRGLVPHIQDVTRRIALEGFMALGVDLLHQSGGTPPTRTGPRAIRAARPPAHGRQRCRQPLRYLKAHASSKQVGATGFCWGGGVVNAGRGWRAGPASRRTLLRCAAAGDQVPSIRRASCYAQNDDNINSRHPGLPRGPRQGRREV
jgi:carboxymethylenebutenolidase